MGRDHSPAPDRAAAVVALRELILSGEHYRLTVATYLGLTVNESQAVSYLFARGPMGQGELGAAMSFTTSSTTALVDRLEKRGIAVRIADPGDRRRSTIALSPDGEKELAEVRQWMGHAFDDIDDGDLACLTTNLVCMAEALRRHTDVIDDRSSPHQRPRRRL